MKLPISSFFEKKEKNNYFLAALLRDDLIKVIIFEDINNSIKVLGAHSEHFPTTLEQEQIEGWIDTFDKAVGTAEKVLPEGAELKKTVFGVKQDWVEEAKIKKEYLQKLKKVSEELDLQPIGFLVFSEAIVHLLQKEQGAPVSGILVELGKNNIIASIIRAGKIIETKEVTLTNTPSEAVEEALKGITDIEILPSRIILFDGNHAESVTQEFISHPWSKNLPFLHVPQVTVLSEDFDAKAVIYGTALQLGMEILDDTLTLPSTTTGEVQPEKKDQVTDNPLKETTLIEEKLEKKEPQEETNGTFPPDHFGFILDKDVAEATILRDTQPQVTLGEEPVEKGEQSHKEWQLPFAKLLAKKKSLSETESIMNDSILEHKKPKFALFIIPIILFLIIGCFAAYIAEVKATVLITISPKNVQASQDITFSTKDDNNFSSDLIHADAITVSENGSVSTDATGKKDLGNPAKGTITIFNSSDSAVNIATGTAITSPDGLKFTIDNTVTVNAASGDIFSGTKPGTVDVTVTASAIGTDSNLPAGTKFSIGSNPSIAAKNTNALSGGTKKQATVVSKTDVDKLVTNLEHSLENKARDDMNKQTTSGKGILPVFLKETIQSQKTDKNINDEAKSVTITGTVSYIGLTYDKNDLDSYAKQLLQNKVDDKKQLATAVITSSLTNASDKDDAKATASLQTSAALVPAIDTRSLTSRITGKSLTQTKDIISQLPQVADSSVTFSPNLFFIPQMLPLFEKHIQIIIRTK